MLVPRYQSCSHFGFISTVPWLRAVRIVCTLMLKLTRGQRRESSYEGSLVRLPHQRPEHHSPTCHRSQRGFATPLQLQADWLCRVPPMYSLTIASLREVLHPMAEDWPLRVLRNPRVVLIQSWTDPASHVCG